MRTINNLFEGSVRKYADNIFLYEKIAGKFQGSTYKQVHEQVLMFCAGLYQAGLRKGDRVALLAEGRNKWVISELALLKLGIINVPLSVKLSEPNDLKFRLSHSGARMIIASGRQAGKINEISHELNELEKIILMDDITNKTEKHILFEEVIKKGKSFLNTNFEEIEAYSASIEENDVANICYTSGTTADPKGIMLTHRNYTANVEQARSLINVPAWYTTLLILPWDHAFAHTAGVYTLMQSGASLAAVELGQSPAETLRNIPKNIKEIKPVFLLSVPALAKNFRKNIEKGIREKGKVIGAIYKSGLKLAYWYNGIGWNSGKGLKVLFKPLYSLYDAILFKKIREGFGGRLKFFIGGGALLDIELQKYFYAIGMPMFQGYGLTEAAPIISANFYGKHKMGASGAIVSDLDVKICDEDGNTLPVGEKGEIVVKGENVMVGYWKNEAATKETIKNGWLHTGDLGFLDKEGFLYVLGRFKSLLIADDGEKYSPEGIEESITDNSDIIDQCMLYNNQNPYTVALICPNKEALNRYLKSVNLDLNSEEGLKEAAKLIEKEIAEYRAGGKYHKSFPDRWLPSAIGILQEGFTEENQLLNSTLKMVRGKVIERYQDRIIYLYTSEAKNICNTKNIEALGNL